MRPTLLVLIALILAACNPNSGPASRSGNEAPRADAASTAAISESDFLSSMAVEGVKTVSYNDENGKPISFDQFIAATMSGQSFQKTFDTQGSMAMFSISPKGSDRARSATSSKYRLKVPLAASAPAIDARDLDGMLHSLSDGTKYTLLSFFFADCVPCIQEVPEINGLPLKRQNLKVLGHHIRSEGHGNGLRREAWIEGAGDRRCTDLHRYPRHQPLPHPRADLSRRASGGREAECGGTRWYGTHRRVASECRSVS